MGNWVKPGAGHIHYNTVKMHVFAGLSHKNALVINEIPTKQCGFLNLFSTMVVKNYESAQYICLHTYFFCCTYVSFLNSFFFSSIFLWFCHLPIPTLQPAFPFQMTVNNHGLQRLACDSSKIHEAAESFWAAAHAVSSTSEHTWRNALTSLFHMASLGCELASSHMIFLLPLRMRSFLQAVFKFFFLIYLQFVQFFFPECRAQNL